MGTFVIKTIKQFARDGESTRLLEKYKDKEDEKFGPTLFGLAVENHEEYRAIIDRHIDAAKWDTERIALMDIVILETALSEILNFPSVPLAVSVNEYVEIANWYSTARSGAFSTGYWHQQPQNYANPAVCLKAKPSESNIFYYICSEY